MSVRQVQATCSRTSSILAEMPSFLQSRSQCRLLRRHFGPFQLPTIGPLSPSTNAPCQLPTHRQLLHGSCHLPMQRQLHRYSRQPPTRSTSCLRCLCLLSPSPPSQYRRSTPFWRTSELSLRQGNQSQAWQSPREHSSVGDAGAGRMQLVVRFDARVTFCAVLCASLEGLIA